MNWKKLYRIYREGGLTVRKRGRRKRALGIHAPVAIPQGPNQRWSLDFLTDSLVLGRRFWVLCINEDLSRRFFAVVFDMSISGHRVARELDRIAEPRGYTSLHKRVQVSVVSVRSCAKSYLFSSPRAGSALGFDVRCRVRLLGTAAMSLLSSTVVQ